MNILGIETSCDETSASIVRDGVEVLSNVVATSLTEHQKFGGIIPEIASRRQLEYINIVTSKAVADAGLTLGEIDAVAVTRSPGLIGSLLVGITFAHSLAYALKKPLIHVNHIHAHILQIGYPGGPVIDRMSREVNAAGGDGLKFPRADMEGTHDFSFSGVKTAVLYHARKYAGTHGYSVEKVAAAFQESVISVLAEKSIEACVKRKCPTLLVGGGVAANSGLRDRLHCLAAEAGVTVSFPSMPFCMDNAAMVAGLAHVLSINHRSH